MPAPYSRELNTALLAAEQAARYLVEAYAAFEVIPNAPASITTDADRRSQEIILQAIRRDFPSDALCAEEDTPTLQGVPRLGARLWIVDPIDGTRGFAQKNGEFSVMIAFVADGEAVVGVVSEPAAPGGARVTYAERGSGCWKRLGPGEAIRCRVTSTDRPEDATLIQSRSRSPQEPTRQVQLLHPAKVVETHSAGVKLARVAGGEADIYVNHYPNFFDWDICAGHVLVSEAGGVVTGLKGQILAYGRPGAHQRHGLVAANPTLHGVAAARLQEW
jgi:3'(2'), 5'-bisphosphate nucleotidase